MVSRISAPALERLDSSFPFLAWVAGGTVDVKNDEGGVKYQYFTVSIPPRSSLVHLPLALTIPPAAQAIPLLAQFFFS